MQAQALETPDDYHDLIVHLLHSGGALWIPGAKPHARNQAVMFEPDDLPTMLRPHPTNPKQTPVIRGQISGLARRPYWCVGARAPGARPRLRAVRARMACRRRAVGRRAPRRGTLRGYRRGQPRRAAGGAVGAHR